jgi:two-component system cell cycle sensor histidine kinase/response regulator CckA
MTTPAKRILVVDDDPDVRRITCLLLRQGGHQLIEASSGAQALDLLAKSADEIALLVTDLRMPEMNGEELARQALAARPGLRVLFVTGYAADAVAAAALAPDRIAVVEKPYSLPKLLARVQEALGD